MSVASAHDDVIYFCYDFDVCLCGYYVLAFRVASARSDLVFPATSTTSSCRCCRLAVEDLFLVLCCIYYYVMRAHSGVNMKGLHSRGNQDIVAWLVDEAADFFVQKRAVLKENHRQNLPASVCCEACTWCAVMT